MKFSKYDTIR